MATVTATPGSIPANLTTSTSLAPKTGGEEEKTQFLQLLVAQLKGQNPLDPQDGTQFVTQLAQFSSLEQLINIRTDLDGMSKAAAPSGSSTTPAGTAASNNPFQQVKE